MDNPAKWEIDRNYLPNNVQKNLGNRIGRLSLKTEYQSFVFSLLLKTLIRKIR